MRRPSKRVPGSQIPVEVAGDKPTISFGQLRKVWNACDAQNIESGYSGTDGFDSGNRIYSVYQIADRIIFASDTYLPGSALVGDCVAVVKLNAFVPLVQLAHPSAKSMARKSIIVQRKHYVRFYQRTHLAMIELFKRTDLDDLQVQVGFKVGVSPRGDHAIFNVPTTSQQAFETLGSFSKEAEAFEDMVTVFGPATVSLHGGWCG